MKPILAFVVAATLSAGFSAALAGTLGGGSGTLAPSSGTFGSSRAGSSYGAGAGGANQAPQPRRFGVPAQPPAPSTSSTSSTTVNGADRFKPFEGRSLYSDRGGVDAYPKPAKPKGYIDPNRRTGF
jgi:hypothetical protein